MSDDEPTDEPEEVEVRTGPVDESAPASTRERIGEEADRAVESFDEGVIDLLSWILDTNTRAQIYVYLRKHPWSTSEEVAEGTGLYPSTVREALAELHDDETVDRRKRETEGAGNNPYEYTAIAPSELVGGIIQQMQDELNTVFNLDRYLGGSEEEGPETEPVSINVEETGDATAEPVSTAPEDEGTGAAGDDEDEATTEKPEDEAATAEAEETATAGENEGEATTEGGGEGDAATDGDDEDRESE